MSVPVLAIVVADGGSAGATQTQIEYVVLAFVACLFFVAMAFSATGSMRRMRPNRAKAGDCGARSSAVDRRPGERGHGGIWQRCLWELEILKAYLAETTGSTPIPEATPRLAGKPKLAATTADRRRWTRHPSNLQAVCWLLGQRHRTTWRARVRDISSGGVGLILSRAFTLGTILELQLFSPGLLNAKPLRAEVMFLTQNQPDEWVLGCEFLTPLTPDQESAYL
jgi:PilZ domain